MGIEKASQVTEIDSRLYLSPSWKRKYTFPNIPAAMKTVSRELQPNSKQGLRITRADCIWQESQTLALLKYIYGQGK